MKYIFTLLLAFIGFSLKSQCGFTLPESATVCVNASITLTATGAASYSWTLNGAGFWQTLTAADTSKFVHTYGWNKTVTIKAELNGCVESKVISITVETCEVGIQEYELNQVESVYFDLYGNRTERRTGIILIEQTGSYRKKVLFY